MLKKLLKYDLNAMFRYWWIAAIISVGLSFAGGLILSAVTVENKLPAPVYVLSVIILFVIMLGFSAFSIMSLVVIFSRFYKNFFTDEGYLTFTLPVKKSSLLNSKIISGFVTFLSTTAVITVDVLIAVLIGFRREIFTKQFLDGLSEFFKAIFEEGFYSAVYLVEGIVIALLIYLIYILFLYCCITFGSIIVKKMKVLASVGVFYVASGAVSSAVQILWLFVFPHVMNMVSPIPDVMQRSVWAIMLLGVICIQAILCTLLYILLYRMLDRKLNLN